jgi:hypothetical protein
VKLSDFTETEVELACHLWNLRQGVSAFAYRREGPVWLQLKPEVKLEFCIYARAILTREKREEAAKLYCPELGGPVS